MPSCNNLGGPKDSNRRQEKAALPKSEDVQFLNDMHVIYAQIRQTPR